MTQTDHQACVFSGSFYNSYSFPVLVFLPTPLLHISSVPSSNAYPRFLPSLLSGTGIHFQFRCPNFILQDCHSFQLLSMCSTWGHQTHAACSTHELQWQSQLCSVSLGMDWCLLCQTNPSMEDKWASSRFLLSTSKLQFFIGLQLTQTWVVFLSKNTLLPLPNFRLLFWRVRMFLRGKVNRGIVQKAK